MIIDESNFNEYFFDTRTHKPQKGQVMAKYTAIAEFGAGAEKRQMIDLLQKPDKAFAATQVMRKLLCASELDAIRVPKEMAVDLLTMTPQQVEEKLYKYVFEMFFYVKPEYIPDDPHWSSISLLNLDRFLEQNGIEIKMRLVEPEAI